MSKILSSPLTTSTLLLDQEREGLVRDVVLLLDRELPVDSECVDRGHVLDLE
jgi:hypothetical protein